MDNEVYFRENSDSTTVSKWNFSKNVVFFNAIYFITIIFIEMIG